MSVKTLLLFLPSFLVLLTNPPVTASDVRCYKAANLTKSERKLTKPLAADCLYIVSVLPSSLAVDPDRQPGFGRLTLSQGRLRSHRFDLPASFIHNTCMLSFSALRADEDNWLTVLLNRQETAYYFWNRAKASAQSIIRTCLQDGLSWGGEEEVHDFMSTTNAEGRVFIEPVNNIPLMPNEYHV